MTIWDAPPELAAHTIHKPTTTLHRHYRSKHGTIFGVSVCGSDGCGSSILSRFVADAE
ncbi:hypothetical protein DAPPUDRAFT_331981 [Daphnia pulex]|uniref:Uncharacterized protein n=1 Tax=Daphnia pulex TaxID=6669 RepID=E9HNX8_DAPPU|nr:hypothetical protein DAPPUDRAFT_331981 [Daphnia pulex]|eukprot:EFX66555.1 hypothetical protein DAPPUDRAFT_331981 [Daphnia pulex]